MIKLIAATARDQQRVREIAGVATRFGLGVLLARLGLAGEGEEPEGALPLPRRTRLALEALGPSFVKIGQILATRGDLLPPHWIEELEQLHSDAPTLDFDTIRAAVEEALGEPPETAFARFDPAPLAGAPRQRTLDRTGSTTSAPSHGRCRRRARTADPLRFAATAGPGRTSLRPAGSPPATS